MRGFIILTTILAAILIGVTAASRAQADTLLERDAQFVALAGGAPVPPGGFASLTPTGCIPPGGYTTAVLCG
jgi:hypothetical protein